MTTHTINKDTTLEPDGDNWQLCQVNTGRSDIVDLDFRDIVKLNQATSEIIFERGRNEKVL
jgi:hypothetical protein